jgi:quercetin dioxygenase-like cupin family protein
MLAWIVPTRRQEGDLSPPQPFRGRRVRLTTSIVLAVSAAFATLADARAQTVAAPQASGVTRADLQRHDLSIPGREAVQVRVDFAPGAVAARHSHPGEEIVYVLKGALEYRLDGKATATLRAGDVLFIPAGAIHGVTNVGGEPASELATYVVEKGKPLVVQAK